MTNKISKKKFFNRWLPLGLSLALVLGAVWVIIRLSGPAGQSAAEKLVIDLSQPINKEPDIVSNIQKDVGNKKQDLVQIKFSWEVSGKTYNDALYLSPEEYGKLTPAQLEALKNERFRNWADLINKQSIQNQ